MKLIALALYAQKLRLLHLKKTRHAHQVENFAVVDLSPQTMSHGKIKEWDEIQAILKFYVKAWRLQGTPTVLAIPNQLVRSQIITLPPGLNDTAIETEIRSYVQRDLSAHDESLSIDFTVLENKLSNTSKIFFTATRQAYLSNYLQCVSDAGLNVKIVDVDNYALVRAASFALDQTPLPNEIIGLLYLEKEITSFIVFNTREILFNQEWESKEAPDLISQIKQTIDRLSINKIITWFSNDELRKLFQSVDHNWPCSIISPSFFSKMRLSKKLNDEKWKADSLLLPMAGGLAIRELPRW